MTAEKAADDESSFKEVQEILRNRRPIAFSVDTNYYVVDSSDQEVNLLQSWQLRAQKLAESGLQCILPAVWEGELTRFTERSVSKWLVCSMPNATALEDGQLKKNVEALNESIRQIKLQRKVCAEKLWKNYIHRCKILIVNSPDDCLPKVLHRYANAKPPFGVGKKSHEFPDAFALEALVQYSLDNESIQVVVASKDSTVLDYCKQSPNLVGFQSIERALDALTNREEIERLLCISREISQKIRENPEPLLNTLSQSLMQLRQLSAYNANYFHPNIPGHFQPYISIRSVIEASIVEISPQEPLVRVQSEGNSGASMNGRARFKVLATGRVSAWNTASEELPTMELDLFPPKEFTFEINFHAYLQRHTQGEHWEGNVDDEGKRLFELPEPPTYWVPAPHA